MDRRLVDQVLQIRAGETGSCARNALQIHIVSQRLVLRVYLQDFFSCAYIRAIHGNPAVETTGTQNRRIQDIHTVRGRHHDNADIRREAVHLHQELIQRLLALIVAAAHAAASLSCHSVDLINKYNTGRMVLRIRKEVAHTGSTDADIHLNKV